MAKYRYRTRAEAEREVEKLADQLAVAEIALAAAVERQVRWFRGPCGAGALGVARPEAPHGGVVLVRRTFESGRSDIQAHWLERWCHAESQRSYPLTADYSDCRAMRDLATQALAYARCQVAGAAH